MKNNTVAAISLVAAMGAASAVQAADMPMSPQDIVKHVAANCMRGFNIDPFSTPVEFAKSWNSVACKEAMELSTAHMDYILDVAFDDAAESNFWAMPTFDEYLVSLEKVLKEFNSDADTMEMQRTIDFLAEMALDGFPTGKGILNTNMEEYATKKGLEYNFDNN